MSDRMLVATRKGLHLVRAQQRRLVASRAPISPASPVTAALCRPRATARSMPCSSTAISAASCIAPTTAGAHWTELPAPAFPADAAGAPALFQVWTLETGGADEKGTLWAGALPAGLFRSDDRGESWQPGQRAVERAGAREMVRRRL